jgi:hypothetical protein
MILVHSYRPITFKHYTTSPNRQINLNYYRLGSTTLCHPGLITDDHLEPILSRFGLLGKPRGHGI